jgi:urea transporter
MSSSMITKLDAQMNNMKKLIPVDIIYTLRGISQVIIVNNAISGIFILAGLYVGGGALLGTQSLVCTLISTILARMVYSDVDSVKNGLAGYNAGLIGCAFAVFVNQSWSVGVIFASIFCALIASIVNLALKASWTIPTYTYAFNVTIITYVLFQFNSPGPLPELEATAVNIILCPLKGISQIWVVNSWIAGLLILIGVAYDSFGIALYALLGAIVGCTTGYVFGGEDALVKVLNGLFGFNSCLMACAVAVFYVPTVMSVCFGIVACIFTELLNLALGNLFDRSIQVPAFTLPFCIVASACHLVLSDGAIKNLIGAVSPTSPESNYRQHRARIIEEEDKNSGELDPTVKVFYGPSAVAVKPVMSNWIDRQPTVEFESDELEDAFRKNMGMHSRPQLLSSRHLQTYSEHDKLVHSTIVRSYAASSNAGSGSLGGSSVLSSITRGVSFRKSAGGGNNTSSVKTHKVPLASIPSQPHFDIPDVESDEHEEGMDKTSSTNNTE